MNVEPQPMPTAKYAASAIPYDSAYDMETYPIVDASIPPSAAACVP
jgi:hypothetical protein